MPLNDLRTLSGLKSVRAEFELREMFIASWIEYEDGKQ